MRRYAPQAFQLVYRICMNYHNAEDIVQEARLKAWLSLDRLRNPEHFRAWLTTIARNLAKDFIKRRDPVREGLSTAEEEEEDSLIEQVPDATRTPFEVLVNQEVLDPLMAALPYLNGVIESIVVVLQTIEGPIKDLENPDYREVLILKYREGLKLKKIAERLNWRTQTGLPDDDKVKTYLARARDQLVPALRNVLLEDRWQQLGTLLGALNKFVAVIRGLQDSDLDAERLKEGFSHLMRCLARDYDKVLEGLRSEAQSAPLVTFIVITQLMSEFGYGTPRQSPG